MKTRLTERQIRYAVDRCQKGGSTARIASELGVTRRRIQQLWAEFRGSGTCHMQRIPGRPRIEPAPGDVQAVLEAHAEGPAGAVRTARRLRENRDISCCRVCRIMRDNGLVTPSAARSRRRKWVRYERRYSNAMWHVDWHEMKDPRFRGLNLVTYLDDASRCVLAARLFTEATSENAVTALADAIRKFGTPATILSDNGKCFVGARSDRKRRSTPPKGGWTPTAFEAELLDRGIELINSRPYHPQTNGKLERFFRSVEEEIFHYESLSAYVEYYNEGRLHFSLDIDNCQTPLGAFSDKKAADAIRKSNPRWMEEDTHGQAK